MKDIFDLFNSGDPDGSQLNDDSGLPDEYQGDATLGFDGLDIATHRIPTLIFLMAN